jgi:hypothetical protein
MIAICFGLAYIVGSLAGNVSDGMLLIVGGPLATVADLGYRYRFSRGSLLSPGAGGRFMFLPVWPFGIFWFTIGCLKLAKVVA